MLAADAPIEPIASALHVMDAVNAGSDQR